MGPVNQIKKMFAPTRVIATIMVLVMLGLTLFSAILVSTIIFTKVHLLRIEIIKVQPECCLGFEYGEKV